MWKLIVLLTLFYEVFGVKSPNFVLIITDDQDLLLDGLKPMTKTKELIADKGAVFMNAFANSPICCPSRSTILTGKFAHNLGVHNNSIEGNCSSKFWQKVHEPKSISNILKEQAGYRTFYAGKYLNQYGKGRNGGTKHVPPGYDWWIGLKGNSVYYNYTLSLNGTTRYNEELYLTDLIGVHAENFIKTWDKKTPFMMTLAPPAAHAPFTPAPKYQNAFPGVKAVRNPSFNVTPTNKHWIVSMPPTHLPENVSILDDIQRKRMQTLLSVDEIIGKILINLNEVNASQNTYVIFTSDNGFHIGQFTQPWDKRQPYETDIRVPFFISGPKIKPKQLVKAPISFVDLAPTILDLANVAVPKDMDGSSFKKVLFDNPGDSFDDKLIFIEYFGEANAASIDGKCPWTYDSNLNGCSRESWCKCQDSRNNTYVCVVDLTPIKSFKFCLFEDNENFVEAYDLRQDPYELNNIRTNLSGETSKYYWNVIKGFQEH